MRVGVFQRHLLDWAERPCILTFRVAATGTEVRISGILRSYHSLSSLYGWALVPPQQHGGFNAVKLTELEFAACSQRDVVLDGHGRKLRFTRDDVVFELERDDAVLTAPPRRVRKGRYHYIGGRRRRTAEPWMLQ